MARTPARRPAGICTCMKSASATASGWNDGDEESLIAGFNRADRIAKERNLALDLEER